MKKIKVRHKKDSGRPSKEMKVIEDYLNDPKIIGVMEEAAKLMFQDKMLFGSILPSTQKKIDKLIKSLENK